MGIRTIHNFKTPSATPNGLQWKNDELFVIDQTTDDVLVLNESGDILRTISTPTENGSGVTVGGGYLWTASNGKTKLRPYRPTDTHLGYIYKLDMQTGKLLERFRTPDGGGVHGLEWWEGSIWVTCFEPPAIALVDPEDFRVIRKFEVDLTRLHGLAVDDDGIWCAHTSDNVIVKYDMDNGKEIERITMNDGDPFVHGLSIKDGTLWYADANQGPPEGTRSYPEIGYIERT